MIAEARRPWLPLPFAIILVAEIAVLATLVAINGSDPPFRYELGWAAVASFVAMQLYTLRRRIRALGKFGALEGWLDAHAFLGLQGFAFVVYHCVGLAADLDLALIDAGVVLVLVLTGMMGRYFVRVFRAQADAMWSFVHRPLALVLLALTTLHVLAHFAYAT